MSTLSASAIQQLARAVSQQQFQPKQSPTRRQDNGYKVDSAVDLDFVEGSGLTPVVPYQNVNNMNQTHSNMRYQQTNDAGATGAHNSNLSSDNNNLDSYNNNNFDSSNDDNYNDDQIQQGFHVDSDFQRVEDPESMRAVHGRIQDEIAYLTKRAHQEIFVEPEGEGKFKD
jgi:hypothetical protein